MSECKICNKQFENNKLLIRHLVKEHDFKFEQLYKYFNVDLTKKDQICIVCGKPFTLNNRQLSDFKKGSIRSVGCSKSCIAYIRTTIKSPLSDKSSHEKAKQTIFNRYGVENLSDIPGVKEKRKQTCLKHYGVEVPMQSNEIKKKCEQTCLKHYGTKTPLNSKEIRDKIHQTNLERYGVEEILSSKEIQEKYKQTNLEKYGDENVWGKNSSKRAEIRQTNLKRYGVEEVLSSKEIRDKIHQTNLERYGAKNPWQSSEIIRKSRENAKKTNLERYGVEYFCQHEKCYKASGYRISKINRDFYDKLIKNGLNAELEYIIENSGFDLKVEDTLIEINPTYTHNSTFGATIRGSKKLATPIDYHLNKTLFANKHNFHCMHIFDWDDKDKIVEMLKSKQKIYARQTEIKQISKKLAKQFLNKYHLQSSTQTCRYAYGLFFNDELVQVMTFGKPRYNKSYEYELLRLCTKPCVEIVGGASKLLKHFEEDLKPSSIISYCDLAKFSGKVYEQLNFNLCGISKPSKHWYNMQTKRHITDNLLRQRGFDQLHNTNYGKGTSNEQLMIEHGYVEIYDVGQATYLKTYKKDY